MSRADYYNSGSYAKTGFWHDDELGWTLTVTDEAAFLIVAFVAIFITSTAVALWTTLRKAIVIFSKHEENPPQSEIDLILILRNVESPLDAAWGYTKQIKKHPIRDTLNLRGTATVILGLCVIGYTTALGIAFPKIVSSDIEVARVAARDDNCAVLVPYSHDSLRELSNIQSELLLNGTISGENYFHTCYEQESPLQCRTLSRQKLEWTTSEHQPCPFPAEACHNKNYGAVVMSTGPLPLAFFGYNIKSNDTLAKKMTCSPLRFDNFVIKIDGKPFDFDGNGFALNFGGKTSEGSGRVMVSKFASQYPRDYVIKTQGYSALATNIREDLARTDGDSTFVVINSQGVLFGEEVHDPVFRAQKESGKSLEDLLREIRGQPAAPKNYVSDSYGIIGCIEQYELCLSSGWCSGFVGPSTFGINLNFVTSFNIFENEFKGLEKADNQRVSAAIRLLYRPLRYSSLEILLKGRGSAALSLRRKGFREGFQGTVHPEQWKAEVSQWFGISLARLQMSVHEIFVGPSEPRDPSRTRNLLDEDPQLRGIICGLYVLQSGDHTSLQFYKFLAFLLLSGTVWILRILNGCLFRTVAKRNQDYWVPRLRTWKRYHISNLTLTQDARSQWTNDQIIGRGWESNIKFGALACRNKVRGYAIYTGEQLGSLYEKSEPLRQAILRKYESLKSVPSNVKEKLLPIYQNFVLNIESLPRINFRFSRGETHPTEAQSNGRHARPSRSWWRLDRLVSRNRRNAGQELEGVENILTDLG